MSESIKSRHCIYPGSYALDRPIFDVLNAVAANRGNCSRFYLDTVESMSNAGIHIHDQEHHQGLARSHTLSDGSVTWFLSHAETDDQGSISWYRYAGPLDSEHILETNPLTVAAKKQLLFLDEHHPSDICFLPDVNHLDAGYLFVTEEFDMHRLSIYRWDPSTGLVLHGYLPQGFPDQGPQFVFIDRVDDAYYLGVASEHWGWVALFTATCAELFPKCAKGELNIDAFQPTCPGGMFPFPSLGGPSQIKLVRDSTAQWYLLAFRADPNDDPHGDDYVDVYQVRFNPFMISSKLASIHVSFPHGDTGFANTGTHLVEESGRLLLSSSYRWAKDEGPDNSGYVSRVDECPAA
jgi:hypothetical protein